MQSATRILLIEDDHVDRIACRRAFAHRPGAFEFIEADTGREGIQLARTARPGCVLLDYRLPDLTGLEVLAGLAAAEFAAPPVVMLTGANDVGIAVEAMRAGARDYLLKDTERHYLELLPRVVERVLHEQRLIDEKQRAEAALAHAHRLMTAGQLAGALAHELNQPLAAIATFSEACRQQLAQPALDADKLRGHVEQIARQAQRAGQTIRELRAFLGKGSATKGAVDLNELIRSTCDLVAAEARSHRVTIVLDLIEPLGSVAAARVHIEHLLLNLLQNAIDALREANVANGTVTVSTRASAEGMAHVVVRDNGPGIGAETAQRIFEPFYTTKGDGLGMGLAIGRTIVEAHDGKLWAGDGAGGGAAFQFTLPFSA